MNRKSYQTIFLLIVTLCIVCHRSEAQELPGKLDTIYSNVLKEKRIIRVVMPDDYKPGSDNKYDVLYVLDGGSNIKAAYPVQRYLEDEEVLPPTIIVSIGNID